MSDLFIARPHPSRRPLSLTITIVAFFTVWHTVGAMFGASAATTGTIAGTAFQDLNRDGVRQADEAALADVLLYLYDASGSNVGYRRTGVDGTYAFSDLPVGEFTVRYAPRDWREVREDWAPTTTGSLYPEQRVDVGAGTVTADFGWRPVERSSTLSAPITEVTGPEGLRVQSYVDVVTAQQIHDHLVTEFHVAEEAPSITVRFGYGTSGTASTGVSYGTDADGNRVVTAVRTTLYAPYGKWLERGDRTLAHEYGHAWMNYHNYLVHQDVDRTWAMYLTARGIDPADERLGSSHAWSRSEIAAEDYRLLLASEDAGSSPHMNRDIPHPADVAGFESWLRDQFATTAGHDAAPGDVQEPAEEDTGTPDGDAPSDEPTSSTDAGDVPAEEEPSPDGTDAPVVDDDGTVQPTEPTSMETQDDQLAETADDSLALVVRAYKVKGVNHADLTWGGAPDEQFHVYRDGGHVGTVRGSAYTDDTGGRGSVVHAYRVCAVDTDVCSEDTTAG